MSRHRPPPWWRRRVPVAVAAGVLLVAAVVATAAVLAPHPTVTQPRALPTGSIGHATGVRTLPTLAMPTIGAEGAWSPDKGAVIVNGQPLPTVATSPRPPQRPQEPSKSPRGTPTHPRTPQTTAAATTAGATGSPLDLVNADRAANGCKPVTEAADLMAYAASWAQQQATDDAMSHSSGPDYTTWGENVAVGYETAADVHKAWMESAPHRRNVLNCAYTVIGYGSADGPSGRYWTEEMAA